MMPATSATDAPEPAIVHPCGAIPQGLVDKIVARRGRLHAYESIDPGRTALVVVDLDEGSCRRDQRSESAIANVNAVADALRGAGGTIAVRHIDDC